MIKSVPPGPREAKIRHLEAGPLHKILEKGWSEPTRVEKVTDNAQSELLRSQENSLRIIERLRCQIYRGGRPVTIQVYPIKSRAEPKPR
jgi:hypothetical protein